MSSASPGLNSAPAGSSRGAKRTRDPIELNPLIARELRSRWRRPNSFFAVFALIVALMLALVLSYSSNSPQELSSHLSAMNLEFVGRQIFHEFATVGVFLCLLIGPGLTAASLALDRQRGALEHLQLTRLKSEALVLGSYGGALLFAALLAFTALPSYAVIFCLGGLSEHEVLAVVSVQACTAALAAALGLAASALSRNVNVAMRGAYGAMALWLLACFGFATYNSMTAPAPPPNLTHFLVWANPLEALRAVEIPRPPSAPDPLLACCLMEIVGIGAALACAVAALNRREGHPELIQRVLRDVDPEPLDRREGQSELIWRVQPGVDPEPLTPSHFQLPFTDLWRMSNPVFRHEITGRFRFRTPGPGLMAVELGLVALVGWGYMRLLAGVVSDGSVRTSMWEPLAQLGLALVMLCSVGMGAAGFSGEKERGTWEAIKLSPLSPATLVNGKLAAIGITLVQCSLLLLPLELALMFLPPPHLEQRLQLTLNVGLILAGSFWLYGALGLWLSLKYKRTGQAIMTAIVGTVAGQMAMSLYLSAWSSGAHSAQGSVFQTMTMVIPAWKLDQVMDLQTSELGSGANAAIFFCVYFLSGCAVLILAKKRVTRELRPSQA